MRRGRMRTHPPLPGSSLDGTACCWPTRRSIERGCWPPKHQATVITKNADVLPTFLVDGFVAGTWLPKLDGDGSPRLDLRPFGRLATRDRDALEQEAARLLPLLGRSAYHRYPGTD